MPSNKRSLRPGANCRDLRGDDPEGPDGGGGSALVAAALGRLAFRPARDSGTGTPCAGHYSVSATTAAAQDRTARDGPSPGRAGYGRLGRLDVAHRLQSQSLTLYDEVGDLDGMAESLDRFAMLAVAQADLRRATTLFGAAHQVHQAAGTSLPPAESEELRSEIAALRARLGDAEFDAGWVAGTRLPKDAAVAMALEAGAAA